MEKSYLLGVSLSSAFQTRSQVITAENGEVERVALKPTFGCVTDTVLSLLNLFSRSMLTAAIVYSPPMLVQLRVTLHVQLRRINRYLHNYFVSTPRHFRAIVVQLTDSTFVERLTELCARTKKCICKQLRR